MYTFSSNFPFYIFKNLNGAKNILKSNYATPYSVLLSPEIFPKVSTCNFPLTVCYGPIM